MTALRKQVMSAEEFIGWAAQQPEKWELFDGIPVAMSPERVVHGDTKYRVARSLDEAIVKAGKPCRFILDSAAVPIDTRNSYQPDVMVYCGEAVPGDTLAISNPIIVVEVLSPGNALRDLRDKLRGYFQVATIQHYLVVDPDKRLVIHHTRRHGDEVVTRFISDGAIALDPPGLTLALPDIFGS
jgi:Uma2 family endonuclease